MKTGYLITARLKSTRLKRKILLDIDGDTVLDKVIKRCKAVKNIDSVILCTSTNQEDAELGFYAKKHNIGFYKGDENDVLKRLLDAALHENIDRFLSITADNPLHSISIGQQILDFDQNNPCDFIFTKELPIGIAPYFIKTNALDVVVFMKKDSDTEIWGPYVKQPDFFRIATLKLSKSPFPPDLRITCDYPADYTFIKELYEKLPRHFPDLQDIYSLLSSKPDLLAINKGIVQRKLDKAILNKIKSDFNNNKQSGYNFMHAKGLLINPGEIEGTLTF